MPATHITKTTFRVADFISWQRSGELRLSPAFQRRSVWSANQKSYLIDTVVRGLPVPIIFIRDSFDLSNRTSVRELVDGQQRLRTLISFVDPEALKDYDAVRDNFVVRSIHNSDVAGRPFDRLPKDVQTDILGYEISTHILPLTFEDRDVLQVFARMNSTGLKLNPQELRNAEFAGAFKTAAYELATEQLDRWRSWGVFTEDQISRMREVDFVSDLLINIASGLTGKTQAKIDKFYEEHDPEWVGGEFYSSRFRRTMDTIEVLLGKNVKRSAWSSEVNFFTLFVVLYDLLWGLGSAPNGDRPKKLPSEIIERLNVEGNRLKTNDVPSEVLDSIQRASADLGRRFTRYLFLRDALQKL